MQAFSSTYLKANWSLARHFIAGTTISPSPQAQNGFNLALHVSDQPTRVTMARAILREQLGAKKMFLWLNQIHSAEVISASNYASGVAADASISRDGERVPVVMTADCLPIVLASKNGACAAIHAGWQGLHKNIIAETIKQFPALPAEIAAWIGPCIRQANYEVDETFFQRFAAQNQAAHFIAGREGHYYADLAGIATSQLAQAGVTDISDCGICTFSDLRFFSHRRDADKAGRMATFVTPR